MKTVSALITPFAKNGDSSKVRTFHTNKMKLETEALKEITMCTIVKMMKDISAYVEIIN